MKFSFMFIFILLTSPSFISFNFPKDDGSNVMSSIIFRKELNLVSLINFKQYNIVSQYFYIYFRMSFTFSSSYSLKNFFHFESSANLGEQHQLWHLSKIPQSVST